MPPLHRRIAHPDCAVGDVDWHKQYPSLFGSVGGDSRFLLWDPRSSAAAPAHEAANAHDGDINCLSFNPFSEFLVATGGADKIVALWDIRKMDSKLHSFEGHTDVCLIFVFQKCFLITLSNMNYENRTF